VANSTMSLLYKLMCVYVYSFVNNSTYGFRSLYVLVKNKVFLILLKSLKKQTTSLLKAHLGL